MLTVSKSEAEIKKFWKQPWDSQGNGQFASDSQRRIRMSDGDPRTGHFTNRGLLQAISAVMQMGYYRAYCTVDNTDD